jgi:outer membrane protein assembly factor BamA
MKVWPLLLIIILISTGLNAIRIAEIVFEADFELDQEALAAASQLHIGTEYNPELLTLAIQNLYGYFHEQDQFYIRIPSPELIPLAEEDLRLIFRLELLEDSSAIQIRFTGLKHFSESILHQLAYTSADARYPLSELSDIMQRVLSIYHQRGYLFAAVQLDSLVMDDGLSAWLKVEEGGVMSPQNYQVQGNEITRESALLKSSGLLGHSLITPQILTQAEGNIKSKAYIRDCVILPLDEHNLLINIEEGRMTFLEGILGLSEKDGNRELSGMINIEFLNLWGTDRGISLYWRNTPTDFSELIFSYHESGLYFIPLAADLALSRTMQDSLWIRSTVETDLYYQSLYQKTGLNVTAQSTLPGSSTPTIEKSRNSSVGAFWKYKNTRGERIPVSGMDLRAAYDYVFAEGKDYGNMELSMRQYLPVSGRFIGFLGAEYRSSENTQLPDYELYSLGGYKSVRGYREDEFKSRKLGWLNSEIRYMVAATTMLYVFYDHGFITQPDAGSKFDLIGLGGGIKLGTRLGILSIEYGLGYRDNKFSNLGLGMIHLGLDIAL